MPRAKTGRKQGRPSLWDFNRRDPDWLDLYSMLLLAKNKTIQPYALPKQLDTVNPLPKPRDSIKLGNKFKNIFKMVRKGREITDEDARQEALDLVKGYLYRDCWGSFEEPQVKAALDLIAQLNNRIICLKQQLDELEDRYGR